MKTKLVANNHITVANSNSVLIDERLKFTNGVVINEIWNLGELQTTFGLAEPASFPGGLDEFIYRGYEQHGKRFVEAIDGKFGVAYYDSKKEVIFIARDWIGEVPLHWLMGRESFVISNRILDLRNHPEYSYPFVHAVPQANVIVIDATDKYVFSITDEEPVSYRSWPVKVQELYYDFNLDESASKDAYDDKGIVRVGREIRQLLFESVERRFSAIPADAKVAVLLSGGIDSMTVAYCVKQFRPDAVAYTLAVDGQGGDLRMAREIANQFGLQFRQVDISPQEVVQTYSDAVRYSEIYHIGNVYCALGMWHLGRRLADDGISYAFCGEGVNEAVGDYTDWIIHDQKSGKEIVLQRVDSKRLSQPYERELYVWGRKTTSGKYNIQLGTGLAKHGIGRMVKPMLDWEINLQCPYLNRSLMKKLTNIPSERLKEIGDKPGLMAVALREDIENGKIPERFFTESKKVRFQDASERGSGGMTVILHQEGFSQAKTIEIFNQIFEAILNPQLDAYRLSHIQ